VVQQCRGRTLSVIANKAEGGEETGGGGGEETTVTPRILRFWVFFVCPQLKQENCFTKFVFRTEILRDPKFQRAENSIELELAQNENQCKVVTFHMFMVQCRLYSSSHRLAWSQVTFERLFILLQFYSDSVISNAKRL
jgi:hypothetical protein